MSVSTAEKQTSTPLATSVSIETGREESRRFASESRAKTLDLTVVVPTKDEEADIASVVRGIRRVCGDLGVEFEILVVDGGSVDETAREAEWAGARVIHQSKPGYGAAVKEAFEVSRGQFILTMDSDLSHPPNVIRTLYGSRDRGDIVVASRYIKGGLSHTSWVRKFLSKIVNKMYSSILDVPVRDISCGFRLYRRAVLESIQTHYDDFSFVQEILVRGYSAGRIVHEVPFHFFPRKHGTSKIRVLKVGLSFMKLLFESRRWRNSVESCDYDERAYDSINLPQRYWQRTRFKIITDYADRNGKVLDLGCGSSRIFESLPAGVGVDVNMKKLRYRRTLGKPLICASVNHVPMRSESFDQVICAEVIEHIPEDEGIFREFNRVLKPGGTLVLGTPDYSRWQWNLVEWLYGKLMPGGYADEHITHYTFDSLVKILERNGFDYLDHKYILQGDLILKARKHK